MINNRIQIGYVSEYNPFKDKKAWSGSIYKLREAIENAGFNVVWIPYKTNTLCIRIYLFVLRLLFRGNDICYRHNKWYYKLVSRTIDTHHSDFLHSKYLFFPGGAQISQYLKPSKATIYYSDASFHSMLNYYWFNVRSWILKQCDMCEKEAIHHATINLRASQWAANSLINHYGEDVRKIFVLPLGPTLESKDLIPVRPYQSGVLRVLFSGVEWERKGGSIAVETVAKLIQNGIDARLIIVGIHTLPEQYQNIEYIEHIGFLNKNNPTEYKQYVETIRQCHILLLPTKAECAGIVFSEASAFGLPIFTYNTGGIGSYVKNEVNGYRLPTKCDAADFSNSICKALKSGKIKEMHHKAITFYQKELAWNNWSNNFKDIINEFEHK